MKFILQVDYSPNFKKTMKFCQFHNYSVSIFCIKLVQVDAKVPQTLKGNNSQCLKRKICISLFTRDYKIYRSEILGKMLVATNSKVGGSNT